EVEDQPAGPLGFIADTRVGEEFGPDLGYGPPRLLRPELVGTIVEALDSLPEQVIAERLGSEGILETYPIGGRYDEPSLRPGDRAEIADALNELRAFMRGSRARGAGVLVWIE